MNDIFAARYTARVEKPIVLFLIGMRLNNFLAVRKWSSVVLAMPRMLAELRKKPESGLLFYRYYFSGRILLVQEYWENFDKLLAYAPGPPSIAPSGPAGRSAFGTRLTLSNPAKANASMSTCQDSVWRQWPRTSKRKDHLLLPGIECRRNSQRRWRCAAIGKLKNEFWSTFWP